MYADETTAVPGSIDETAIKGKPVGKPTTKAKSRSPSAKGKGGSAKGKKGKGAKEEPTSTPGIFKERSFLLRRFVFFSTLKNHLFQTNFYKNKTKLLAVQ